jgi:N utilization substance protein B
VAARSRARKRALDVLFEADQRGVDPLTVLDRISEKDEINPLVSTLVRGVVEHQAVIDETIETYAEGWPLTRMPAVDRAIARVGVYELLYSDDVPDAVAVDEAIKLATELSTDDSPAFLNGLLGRIADIKHRISRD